MANTACHPHPIFLAGSEKVFGLHAVFAPTAASKPSEKSLSVGGQVSSFRGLMAISLDPKAELQRFRLQLGRLLTRVDWLEEPDLHALWHACLARGRYHARQLRASDRLRGCSLETFLRNLVAESNEETLGVLRAFLVLYPSGNPNSPMSRQISAWLDALPAGTATITGILDFLAGHAGPPNLSRWKALLGPGLANHPDIIIRFGAARERSCSSKIRQLQKYADPTNAENVDHALESLLRARDVRGLVPLGKNDLKELPEVWIKPILSREPLRALLSHEAIEALEGNPFYPGGGKDASFPPAWKPGLPVPHGVMDWVARHFEVGETPGFITIEGVRILAPFAVGYRESGKAFAFIWSCLTNAQRYIYLGSVPDDDFPQVFVECDTAWFVTELMAFAAAADASRILGLLPPPLARLLAARVMEAAGHDENTAWLFAAAGSDAARLLCGHPLLSLLSYVGDATGPIPDGPLSSADAMGRLCSVTPDGPAFLLKLLHAGGKQEPVRSLKPDLIPALGLGFLDAVVEAKNHDLAAKVFEGASSSDASPEYRANAVGLLSEAGAPLAFAKPSSPWVTEALSGQPELQASLAEAVANHGSDKDAVFALGAFMEISGVAIGSDLILALARKAAGRLDDLGLLPPGALRLILDHAAIRGTLFPSLAGVDIPTIPEGFLDAYRVLDMSRRPSDAQAVQALLGEDRLAACIPCLRVIAGKRRLVGAALEISCRIGLPWFGPLMGFFEGITKAKRDGCTPGDRMADWYHDFTMPKKNGGTREITAPAKRLKKLQRTLLDKGFALFVPHPAATGFRQGYSIVDNARRHCGKKVVVTCDIRRFFPSTKFPAILKAAFRLWGGDIGPMAAWLVAEICSNGGGLPTGAPTSPAIANIVLMPFDSAVEKVCARSGVTYSRFADDLTFSCDGDGAVRVLPFVHDALATYGYRIAADKTNIFRAGRRQVVTGLVVNERPTLARSKRRFIRAAVHASVTGRPTHLDGHPVSQTTIEGKISYLGMTRPQEAKNLRAQLRSSDP